MDRKILGICAALVALGAFAIAPSMASATLTLQDTVGANTEKIAVGKTIIADSEGAGKFNNGTGMVFACNENIITGTVTRNDGNEVRWTIEGAWIQSNLSIGGTRCKTPFEELTVTFPGLTSGGGKGHWCLRTIPNKDEWELWGNGCETEPGSGELTFILGSCAYKKLGSIKGAFTTVSAAHEATTLSFPVVEFLNESSPFCQPREILEEFKFNLYTDTDETLSKTHSTHTFGSQPTADPVFLNPVA
jgi:hypothetical protein